MLDKKHKRKIKEDKILRWRIELSCLSLVSCINKVGAMYRLMHFLGHHAFCEGRQKILDVIRFRKERQKSGIQVTH